MKPTENSLSINWCHDKYFPFSINYACRWSGVNMHKLNFQHHYSILTISQDFVRLFAWSEIHLDFFSLYLVGGCGDSTAKLKPPPKSNSIVWKLIFGIDTNTIAVERYWIHVHVLNILSIFDTENAKSLKHNFRLEFLFNALLSRYIRNPIKNERPKPNRV